MARLTVLALTLPVAVLACAHAPRLVPAAGATVAPGQPRVAEATADGVRVQVDGDAWKASHVRDVLSPVLVRLENDSQHPLRVAYSEFTLSGGGRFRLQALPPYQVAAANATAVAPAYAWSGFWLAPWDAPYYRPGLPVWGGGLVYDPGYYAGWDGAWPAPLPDRDVVSRALPEGVIDPGGNVSGFLYFPELRKGSAAEFVATLVDAQTNQSFGSIRIPFSVR